jgi:Leucine-rich repeat (LRR) protein
LFKNIDPDTERIDFTNSSNQPLNLSFPKELANLKNLQTFYVEKGLSKVPDELKGLKNLEFLSLPNNPNLTELPEWIADLPNLIALSVKGSNPNLKIPERLQQRFVENGGEVWFVQN